MEYFELFVSTQQEGMYRAMPVNGQSKSFLVQPEYLVPVGSPKFINGDSKNLAQLVTETFPDVHDRQNKANAFSRNAQFGDLYVIQFYSIPTE